MFSLKQIRALQSALLVVALGCAPVLAGETYYRWVDEQGTEVNSDQPPPPGIDYEVIRVRQSMTVPVTDEERAAIAGSDQHPGSAETAVSPSVPRMVAEKNPEACAAARKNLETLNSFARIRMPDGNGSYRYIDEKEKAEQRAQAEATIAANCE